MSVTIVCYWSTLFRYARAAVDARRSGDPERIAAAEAAHKAYERACLDADEVR